MQRTVKAHLALFTVNFIYGVNYVVAKGLMPDVIGPSGFILLRVLGAGLLFWTLFALRPERVTASDLARLVACGFFGIALNQMMFFHGLMRTTPLNSSIIMVATPVLVLVLSAVLLGERVTWTKVLGILLGSAGAITLIDQRMHSREPPSKAQVHRAKELFETIQYPALMHCKSGADRAGAMAVLYKHFKMGLPIADAVEQLRFKYLHVRQGKTGVIDYFFERYLEETKQSGKPFLQWVDEDYDQKAIKGAVLGEWWANLLVDKILRRE